MVLDATFADIAPLGVVRMPPIFTSLVHATINSYFALNVADLAQKYPGIIFISLIRHTPPTSTPSVITLTLTYPIQVLTLTLFLTLPHF